MPPVDPATHRWQVALPTGTEGPYSESELRDLVRAGRVRPTDHVIDISSQRSCLVTDVVSDARELAVGSERIVRRSKDSDRQQVAKPGTGSEVRRFRSPLPGMIQTPAPEPAPVDVDPVAPVAPSPPPAKRRQRLLLGALGVLTVAVVSVLAIWPPGLSQDAGLQPYGVWRVDRIASHPRPWQFSIHETGLTVTGPDGTQFASDVIFDTISLHAIRMVLATPHPVLGSTISLHGDVGNEAVLDVQGGSGRALRLP